MSYNSSQIKVFSDFDGTIVQADLGDEVFKQFGDIEPYNSQLKNGELSIFDYWKLVCNTVKNDASEHEIVDFALTFDLDPYFKNFVVFCSDNSIELSIISDGFDTYINPLLKKNDINLKVYSNKLEFLQGLKPVYRNASESCNCMCASCKKNTVLNNTGDDDVVIYIGDGVSDFCAAEHCDIIFAKGALDIYCNKNSIPHHQFKSFFDVKNIIGKLISKQKLKKRNRAKVLRNRAFFAE